jgi:hypothetical protein
MNPDIGDHLVPWTARLAVAVYLVRLLADLAPPPVASDTRISRERIVLVIWTLGCGVYLLHVAAAFQFVHGWSHAAAAAHTARQTDAVTGWYWTGGLWINYAFTLWWPLDVAWSWRRGLARLPFGYIVAMHGSVGVLIFNATVVFGPSWWRWVMGLVATLLIGVACLRRERFQRTHRDHTADA